MASHTATLLLASGVTRFAYGGWFWPAVGSTQIIGDDAKTYLLANRAGWFEYAVADADATIETPNYVSRRRLGTEERAEVRRILTSDPDVAGPLQIPRVADDAARAALTPVHDGDVVYQLDTDKFYIRAAGAWVIVPSLEDLGTAATKDTGTTSGTIPLLGASGLPAVSGENLTGITAAQISGLGTATPSSTTTVSTGSVAASGTYDFTVAIPGATDRAMIGPIKITKTAGDSTSLKLAAYTLDNRSDTARFVMGEANSALTVDPGPVVGPWYPLDGGKVTHAPMPIINLDGTASIPFRLTNGSGADSGTWTIEVTLTGLPDAA